MTISEMRVRYRDNISVIDKLKEQLNHDKNNSVILDSIKMVEEEQDLLYKKIKRHVYRNISKKDVALLKKEVEKDIILDKDSIVIENVEEEQEPIKVINITEKEVSKNLNDDITEVLKTEKISEEELKDARVVFDGTYKLIYDNGNKIYEEKINDVLLEHNYNDDKTAFNFNIIKLLKDFDEKNDTNLYNRYMINDIKVEYNFDKKFNKEEKAKVRKVKVLSKRESKVFGNVTIKDNRLKKFRKGLAIVAAAGLFLFGGINSRKLHDKNIETSNSNTVVYDAGQTDAVDSSIEEATSIVDETSKKIDEVSTKIVEKNTKDTTKVTKNESNTKKEEVKEEVKEEPKENLKIGDVYSLDSVDLYYASTDEAPLGDTEYAKETGSTFKINLISVVYNNQVMKLVNNDSMDLDALQSICKEKYGDNFKIFVNSNELDKDGNLVTKNVGWVPLDQVLSKGKVLKR